MAFSRAHSGYVWQTPVHCVIAFALRIRRYVPARAWIKNKRKEGQLQNLHLPVDSMPKMRQDRRSPKGKTDSKQADDELFFPAHQFGSVSILAHMILILPHPFKFSSTAPSAPSQTQSPSPSSPAQASSPSTQTQIQTQSQSRPRRPSPFSKEFLRSRLFHRPLEGFSDWLSPASRIYRGLTPQYKVFLQIAAMTLGGCLWAERRVNDYIDLIRKTKRAERLQAQYADRYRE